MASTGGANTAVDGLVFGYDTGYPLVSGNLDTYKFNRGEPTTNLITSNGLDFTQMSTYGNLGRTQVVDSNSPTGYACEMEVLDGATINSAARIRFGDNTNMPSTGNAMVSVYVKFEGGPTSNIVPRVYTGTNWWDLSPLDSGSPYLTSKYRRFGVYTSLGTGSGGPNPGFSITQNNSNIQTGQITRWHSPQVTLKSHATPFTTGTRSATQSLIDLTRTTNIDVSNVSFDSTGQPTFDGTNDYIEISDHSITSETNLTVSYWFKMNWVSSWSPFITLMDSNGTQKFHTWFGSDRGIDFQTSINSVKPMFVATAGAYPNNDYINIVMTVNGTGSNNIKCYVNGEYKAQGSVTFNTHNIANLRIGRDPNNAYGGGDIPIAKIYNRALTAQEIKQNYNAVKERFNL